MTETSETIRATPTQRPRGAGRSRIDRYEPTVIEPAWQARWEESGLHRTDLHDESRPKYLRRAGVPSKLFRCLIKMPQLHHSILDCTLAQRLNDGHTNKRQEDERNRWNMCAADEIESNNRERE